MAYYPPHAWLGAHGGYQPLDHYHNHHLLAGIPDFMEAPASFPPFGFPGGGGPPPGVFMGGGSGPPPPYGSDFMGGPGMPMPLPPPPPHPAFDPYGGGFVGQWMVPPGGHPGGGGFPGGGGGWHLGGGGGGDDGDDDDDDGAAKKGDDKKDDNSDEDGGGGPNPRVTHRADASGARHGVGMIYNPKQTRLHIFRRSTPFKAAWKKKDGASTKRGGFAVSRGEMGGFNIWDADVNWTVKQLMAYLGKGDDRWAVTEVTEAGNGRWYKGSTIAHKAERAAETLSKQGWTEKRGQPWAQAPVWLVVHKVEE